MNTEILAYICRENQCYASEIASVFNLSLGEAHIFLSLLVDSTTIKKCKLWGEAVYSVAPWYLESADYRSNWWK